MLHVLHQGAVQLLHHFEHSLEIVKLIEKKLDRLLYHLYSTQIMYSSAPKFTYPLTLIKKVNIVYWTGFIHSSTVYCDHCKIHTRVLFHYNQCMYINS